MYKDKRVVSTHYNAEAVLFLLGEATQSRLLKMAKNKVANV